MMSPECATDNQSSDGADVERILELRSELDRINIQLLELIETRGRLVHEVMVIKRRLGRPAHDPSREHEMLNALLARAVGVYPRASLVAIFRAIFVASRALSNDERLR